MVLLLLLSSCDLLFKETPEKQPLASVGDTFLYREDITPFIQKEMSPQDSARFVTHYISNWAAKQLLHSKAEINLPQEKLEAFDRLVQEYQTDLYTNAYIEALVQQAQDTAVNPAQLKAYYEKEKENFRLREKIVQLRFVALPAQFLDKEAVKQKIRTWEAADKAYLDSIAIQFKKVHFNDSIWVNATRVMEEIPPLNLRNEKHYLKPDRFFELQDSTTVYLGKITNVLDSYDTAPFEYIAPEIRQLIFNRRRLDYVKKLKVDILEEALKNHEFRTYE